ncbi:hypothetical protein CVT26_010948, partial [Gymnopilus dilepis]
APWALVITLRALHHTLYTVPLSNIPLIQGQASTMGITDETLGAAYIGLLAAAVLYGVTTVQTFIYARNFKHDPSFLKIMVRTTVSQLFLQTKVCLHLGRVFMVSVYFDFAMTFTTFLHRVLDTMHFAFIAQGLYVYLIRDFGDFFALDYMPWLFTRRIFILCNDRKTLAWCLVVPIVSHEATHKSYQDLMTTAEYILLIERSYTALVQYLTSRANSFWHGLILKLYSKLTEVAVSSTSDKICDYFFRYLTSCHPKPLLYVSFACTVVADASIAASLCTLLIQKRTNFGRINTTLQQYALWPQRLIYLGAYFTLSKLYLNAYLASLNARSTFRHQSDGHLSTPIHFPTIQTDLVTNVGQSMASHNSASRLDEDPGGKARLSSVMRESED